MVLPMAESPRPPTIARVTSLIHSPACDPTSVAPTIASLPRFTWTRAKPSSSPSVTARFTAESGTS